MNQQHIIVDGYNYVLRGHFDASNENALWQAREELIRKLTVWRGSKHVKITIVFDGQDIRGITHTHRSAGIQVLFSSAPQKADPLIIQLVDKARQARNITVATSDRSLAYIVRTSGCTVWSSEELAKKLNSSSQELEYKQKYNYTPNQDEIDEWIQLFGKNKKDKS